MIPTYDWPNLYRAGPALATQVSAWDAAINGAITDPRDLMG
jgi:hypothetical protein